MSELLIDDLIPVSLVIGAASGHIKCLSPAAKSLWGDISCAPASGQILQSGITWDAQKLPHVLSDRLELLGNLTTPHLAATLIAGLQEQIVRGLSAPKTWGLVLLPSPSPPPSPKPTDFPIHAERRSIPVAISPSQTVLDRCSELPESPPVLARSGSSLGPETPVRSAGMPQELPRPEQQQEEEQQQREAAAEEEQFEYPQQQAWLSFANAHGLDQDQLGPHQQHPIGHQQELYQTDPQVDAQGHELQQQLQQQGLPRQDALVHPTESSLLDGPPGRRLAPPRQPVPWVRAADVPPLLRRPPPPGVNADPSQPYYISDVLQLRNVPHAISVRLHDDAPDNAATPATEGRNDQGIALPHDRAVSSRAIESEMAPGLGPRPGMAPPLENSPDRGPSGFGGEYGRRHNLEDSARGLGIYTRIPPPRAAAAAAVLVLALASGRFRAHGPRWATAAERNAGVRRLAAPVLRTAAVSVGEQAGPSTTPASATAPAAIYAAGDGAAWQGGVRRSMSMQVNPEGSGGSGHSGSWLEGSRPDRDLPNVFLESRASRRTSGLSPRFAHMGQVAPILEAGEEAVMDERVWGVQESEMEVARGQNEGPRAAVEEVEVGVEAEVESAAQRERSTLQRPAETAAGAVSVWDARVGVGAEVPEEHVDAVCSPFTGAQAAAAASSSDSSEYSPFALSQTDRTDYQLQSSHHPQHTHQLYHTQRPTRLAAAEAGLAAAATTSTNTGGRGPQRLRRRSTRRPLHTLLAEHLGITPRTAPARLWPSVHQPHRGRGGGGCAGAGGSEGGAGGQGSDPDGDRQGVRGEDEADEQQQPQQEQEEEKANSQEESQSDTRSCWYMAQLHLVMPRPTKSGVIRQSAAVPSAAASGGPSTSTSQPPPLAAPEPPAAAAALAASASGNELHEEPLLRLVLYNVDELVRDAEKLEDDLAEVTEAAAAAVQRETQLETLLTCQHKLLEAVFPRQAIEHMTRNIASQSPPPAEPRPPPHPTTACAFSSRRSLIAIRAAIKPSSFGTHPPTGPLSNSRVCIATTINRVGTATPWATLLSTTDTSLETALLPHGLMTTCATTAAPLSLAAAAAAADNDGLWVEQGGRVPRRLRAVPVAPRLPGHIASTPTAAAAAAASVSVRDCAEGLGAAAGASTIRSLFLSLPAQLPSLLRLQQQQGRLSAADLGVGGGAAGAFGTIPLAFTAPMVTVLFADIVGFTSMCTSLKPMQVMAFLNSVFTRLDSLCDIFGVYKVETIGDCYMVAGGLIAVDGEGFKAVRGDDSVDTLHALKAMSCAKAMLREVAATRMPHDNTLLRLRVGLHSGPVTAGIVGSKMPRFCLFGDTVNTASRMESTCEPGRIHVSAATRELLPEESWRPTGGMHIKGKGEMETYLWCPPPDFLCPKSAFSASAAVGPVGGHHYPGGGAGGDGAGAVQRPGWSGPGAPPVAGGAAGGRSAIPDGELVQQQMALARAAATAAAAAGAGTAAAVTAVAGHLGQEEPSAAQ